jgi:hypothetical protein
VFQPGVLQRGQRQPHLQRAQLLYVELFWPLPPSSITVSIGLGLSGSLVLPPPLDEPGPVQLTIPISVTGMLTFRENGIDTDVFTLTGTGTASVAAFYNIDPVPFYSTGGSATMSFTGIAIDVTPVPEPSTWVLFASGFIALGAKAAIRFRPRL